MSAINIEHPGDYCIGQARNTKTNSRIVDDALKSTSERAVLLLKKPKLLDTKVQYVDTPVKMEVNVQPSELRLQEGKTALYLPRPDLVARQASQQFDVVGFVASCSETCKNRCKERAVMDFFVEDGSPAR